MNEKTIQTEGETTEEAIEAALQELGVGEDQVEIEVLEEPNKGLLGLRKAKARVRVTLVGHEELAKKTVEDLMNVLGAQVVVASDSADGELWIKVKSLEGDESPAWLIGHHGQTLDAIQTLASAIVSKKSKAPARMIVEVDDYRERRKKQIQAIAERTVGKVLARHEAISLRPMSAVERKIVHMVVAEYAGAKSMSTGTEPNRFVIIAPINDD